VLDDAGGPTVKIIAQVDCADAIRECDEILAACDGIMVRWGRAGLLQGCQQPA
jgi:pyruvate kinase